MLPCDSSEVDHKMGGGIEREWNSVFPSVWNKNRHKLHLNKPNVLNHKLEGDLLFPNRAVIPVYKFTKRTQKKNWENFQRGQFSRKWKKKKERREIVKSLRPSGVSVSPQCVQCVSRCSSSPGCVHKGMFVIQLGHMTSATKTTHTHTDCRLRTTTTEIRVGKRKKNLLQLIKRDVFCREPVTTGHFYNAEWFKCARNLAQRSQNW